MNKELDKWIFKFIKEMRGNNFLLNSSQTKELNLVHNSNVFLYLNLCSDVTKAKL